jgi:hypothetical protein
MALQNIQNPKERLINAMSNSDLRREIYVPCSTCLKDGTESQFEISWNSRMIVCFACGSYVTFEDFINPDYKIHWLFDTDDFRVRYIIDTLEEFKAKAAEQARIKEMQRLEQERLKAEREYWINHMRYQWFNKKSAWSIIDPKNFII